MTSHRGEYHRKRKKKRFKMVFIFLLLLLGVVAFSLLHVKRSPCNPTLVRTEWVWGKKKKRNYLRENHPVTQSQFLAQNSYGVVIRNRGPTREEIYGLNFDLLQDGLSLMQTVSHRFLQRKFKSQRDIAKIKQIRISPLCVSKGLKLTRDHFVMRHGSRYRVEGCGGSVLPRKVYPAKIKDTDDCGFLFRRRLSISILSPLSLELPLS